jgi:hypothetical protein
VTILVINPEPERRESMITKMLMAVVLMLVAASPVRAALTYDYDVTGALVLPGHDFKTCGLSCAQVVVFSFDFQYVPFKPDPFQGDDASWTHRAVALPATDVVSAVGPLGPFSFPGASYSHRAAIPSATSGPAFVLFVTARGDEIDLWAFQLRTCPSPCEEFSPMSTFPEGA